MKPLTTFLCLAAFSLLSLPALAGNLTFRFRDAAGNLHNVTNMDEVRRLVTARDARGRAYIRDYKTYRIFKKYLDDVQPIKDRVKEMGSDIQVTVNASEAKAHDPGSWSTGPEIQIQTWDDYRAVSTLAHEVAHSYMKDKCGKNTTQGMDKYQKYGKDGDHYFNEITNPRTALSEGYAEYHGDAEGGGQERVGCAGQGKLEKLRREGADFQKPDGKWYFNYEFEKWKDVDSAADLWACEGINATMLRDFAKHIPDGAAKIEELMCEDTLQDVIKAWVAKYPDDAATIAKIVDANTNYQMTAEQIKDLTGANDYADKEHAGLKAKYQGKSPCDTANDLFPPAPPGGGGAGDPGKGMKRFR